MNKHIFQAIAAALFMAGDEVALAATRTWTGLSPTMSGVPHNNLWSNPFNWSPAGTPAAGEDLVFPGNAFQVNSVDDIGGTPAFNTISVSGNNISGAALALNAGLTITNSAITLASIKLNNDQTWDVPAANVSSVMSSAIDTNGKALTVFTRGTFTLAGVISGSGELTTPGPGTTQLAGNNTYTGETLIGDGSLLVLGLQPASPVRIITSGTLGGGGTVGPVTVATNDCIISPGGINNGTAVLTAKGVTFQSGGIDATALAVDLNGLAPGTDYDVLKGSPDGVIFGDNTILLVRVGLNFNPPPGSRFTIVKNERPGPIQGSFAQRPEGTKFAVGNTIFDVTYQGGDGNDVDLSVFSGTMAFTFSEVAVDENFGAAHLTLSRTGGGSARAVAKVTLADETTSPADYRFAPGTLDTGFNPPGTLNPEGADNIVLSSAAQPDGRIVIAGAFSRYNRAGRNRVARLNPDGTLDTTFNPVDGPNDTVYSVAVQADGKVVIGGSFTSVNGTGRGGVARLNQNGSLDTTFNPSTGADGLVDMVALQPDGKIIVVGAFANFNGTARQGIARVHPNGALDLGFNPGSGPNNEVFAVAVQADSKVLIGGRFTTYNGTARHSVARLKADGSLDTIFNPGTGLGAGEDVFGIHPLVDGRTIITGAFTSYNGTARASVARLGSDGSLDLSFTPDSNLLTLFGSTVQPDGKIIVGGSFNRNGTLRKGVLRLNDDGSLDSTFSAVFVTGQGQGVLSVTLQGDGKIIMAGAFGGSSGTPLGNLGRLNGDLFATWEPNDFSNKDVRLPIVDDVLPEADETLKLTLVPLGGGDAGTPSTAELRILDNDPDPTPTATPTASPTATPTATPTAKPTATATATPTATPTATAASTTLGNISTRLRVETGDNVLIGGFIITGTEPKKVVLRAIGPSLNLPGQLENPTLELYSGSTLIASNDDWQNQPIVDQQAVIDSTVAPTNDLESALVRTLPANGSSYTAIVRGANNSTGIGVIEAFDLDRSVNSKLANISTRGLVQTGDNILIAGTIILGQNAQTVLIRAIAPSLPIPGKLDDPTLELRDQNGGLVEANDNWVDSPNKQAIIDTTIPPTSDKESAIVQTLPANGASYTAIVRGVNNAIGIAVVEVYALQ